MVRISQQEKRNWEKLSSRKDIVHLCSELDQDLKTSFLVLKNLNQKNLLSIKKNLFTTMYKKTGSPTFRTRSQDSGILIGGRFDLFWLLPGRIYVGDRIIMKKIINIFMDGLVNFTPQGSIGSFYIREEGRQASAGVWLSDYMNRKDEELQRRSHHAYSMAYFSNWQPYFEQPYNDIPRENWTVEDGGQYFSCFRLRIVKGRSVEDWRRIITLREIKLFITYINREIKNLEDAGGFNMLQFFDFAYIVDVLNVSESRRLNGCPSRYDKIHGLVRNMDSIKTRLSQSVMARYERGLN